MDDVMRKTTLLSFYLYRKLFELYNEWYRKDQKLLQYAIVSS